VSPLIHLEASWLAGARLSARTDRILVTLAGVLPDVDGLSLFAGEAAYVRWHHVLTHGVVAAVLIAALFAALARDRAAVALLSVFAFHLHLLADLAGSGPGWGLSYFWPFSSTEVLWRGQWNLASWQNAVIGLFVTLAALACAIPLGRTPVELVSSVGDGHVVRTLRARFGGGVEK
jgi:inner membrane protein